MLPTLSWLLRPLLLLVLPLAAWATPPAEDDRPVVNDSGLAPSRPADGALPTLWLAGDSTVNIGAPKGERPMRGWGQELNEFFDPAKINLVNRAIGGRSSRTFFTEGRWQKILDDLRPGDWVIIQFGHNDVGHLDARSKYRGSLKSIGDETEDVTLADGSVETVRSYGWYLKTYARTAREKGANVVLCSPVPHKDYVGDWSEWRGWVQASAAAEQVYFIDLCELIRRGYEQLTAADLEAFFADARTHTTVAGARFNARALVSGLRALPGAPLDEYLSAIGGETPPAGR